MYVFNPMTSPTFLALHRQHATNQIWHWVIFFNQTPHFPSPHFSGARPCLRLAGWVLIAIDSFTDVNLWQQSSKALSAISETPPASQYQILDMSKRLHSPGELDEVGGRIKAGRLAPGDNDDAPAGTSSAQGADPVQITVSLRSSSKATRNDLKPDCHYDDHYWQQLYEAWNRELDTSNETTTQKSPTTSPAHMSLGSTNAASIPPGSGDSRLTAMLEGEGAVPEQLDVDIQPHDEGTPSRDLEEADRNSS
jgi:hypothetical protein